MSYVATLTNHMLKINDNSMSNYYTSNNTTSNNSNNSISIVYDKYGTVWFKYADVLRFLEYRHRQRMMQILMIDSKKYNELYITDEIHLIFKNRHSQHIRFINETGLFHLLSKTSSAHSKRFIKEYFNIIAISIRKYGVYKANTRDKIKIDVNVSQYDIMERTVKQFNIENYIKSIHGHICIYEDVVNIAGKRLNCYKLLYTKNINKRIVSFKAGNYNYYMMCYLPLIFSGIDIVTQRFREKQLKKYIDIIGYATLKELKCDLVQSNNELRYATCYCIKCNSPYKLSSVERHSCNKSVT
jgi:prophage antirepressor-like protein